MRKETWIGKRAGNFEQGAKMGKRRDDCEGRAKTGKRRDNFEEKRVEILNRADNVEKAEKIK